MSREFLPAIVMVLVQVGFAGLNILSKLAMDSGMNPFVMVAYRQIIATLVTGPFAYFWERKTREKITKTILFQIFLCSIFGATMNQCLYYLGLKYSSTTIACALNNLLPAVIFIMAVPFRMETVGIKKAAGQAKIIGTILCVGGAMLMTFYKGELIHIWESNIHWRYAIDMRHRGSHNGQNMVLGCMLVVGSCFGWAIWFIIQAKMSKNFASPYSSCSLMTFMASIECFIIGACVERKASGWALGWDIRLIVSLYTGIVNSGISFCLMNWCIQRRGPLFVSMFSPLLLIIVAIFGWAFLDEKLYVGSAAGSALIVVGLYAVLWGKGKEFKKICNINVKTMGEEHEERAIDLPMYKSDFQDEEISKENGNSGV
ncbi:nodulin MtN21 /EamA-like transporter family protein isoform X2 [Tasmannia lanceolata]|uniref:nodulin MtN21 /EamA-like transporter family protein isoform X2 n=1 Tax=Tasmannia lanceolata TaxID=3420 RepID=UPI0040648C9A